jgi:hypothetical protein
VVDETGLPDEAKAEPELQRPDEAVKDLEPDMDQAEAVVGGTKLNKVTNTD